MLTSGDVIDLQLGLPEGREAGFLHPAVVVTAQRILDASPSVIQVVPFTKTIRGFGAEVIIESDADNGLDKTSSAQCQHVRSVSVTRVKSSRGNVGPIHLAQIRETIALILDVRM